MWNQSLFFEASIIDLLKGVKGIPHYRDLEITPDFNYMVFDVLGHNLQAMFEAFGGQMPMPYALAIVSQVNFLFMAKNS